MRVKLVTGAMVVGLLCAVVPTPTGAAPTRRVEKRTYYGSAIPLTGGGFSCNANSPDEESGIGCVYFERLVGDRFVTVSINPAVGEYATAWLAERDADGKFVIRPFCTETPGRIRLDPETIDFLVVIWQGLFCGTGIGPTPSPAPATNGEVTVTIFSG